ncbi:MAG: sulfur carrier protein ThiS [Fusicatenibacter sp.]|nr:sulfur carrier protein ThiS [Fusicatenibacter sp.]
MIRINGEELELDQISLKEYLDGNGYDARRIAVECNETIVPKSQFDRFLLHAGDVVEIVSFVGGG